jgi:hypothetical protein
MALLAFLHIEATLALCNHPPLERFPQCLVVFADNVYTRDLTVSGIYGRNSQRAHGECTEQLHNLINIPLVAAVIKYKVDTVLRESYCSVLSTG